MRKFGILCLLVLAGAAHAANAPDDFLVTGPTNRPITAGRILVTPSGGVQTTLGAALASGVPGNAAGLPANAFWANAYGNCTWGTAGGNDVGPCINAAIAAAAAAGGGTVMVPAGAFNTATATLQTTRGVHIKGAGVGHMRDGTQPALFRSVTRLIWTGAANATMLTLQPAGTETLYSADVTDIVFDCASLAATCVKIANVSDSAFNFGVSEPRSVGAYFTTLPSFIDGPGVQNNDITVYARSTDTNYSPTGILLDGQAGSNFNVSYNRIWHLSAWYMNGDGIVIGGADTDLIYDIETYLQPGGTGSPVIIAAPGYVMPNGQATSLQSVASNMHFLHVGTPITVQGFTVGSTIVPGANAGTAAITPVTLTTNATGDGRHIYFASTTGVAVGMDFSCVGGQVNGLPNHSAVARIAATNVEPTFANKFIPSGVFCTFGWGMTSSAVGGTYTITATGASTYNITAPAGGHSQSGIAVASGVLAFTDVVLPITGSAVAGDTFVITVPAAPGAPYAMRIDGVDSINGIPNPYFAPGAQGSYSTIGNPYPAWNGNTTNSGIYIPLGQSFCNNLNPTAPQSTIVIGSCSGSASASAFGIMMGGTGNTISGFGSVLMGGQNNVVGGTDGFIGGGNSVTVNGKFGRGGGNGATDHGNMGDDCWASGSIAVNGDAQGCHSLMHNSGSSTTAVRMTVDGLTASSVTQNCINIPANTVFLLTVDVAAVNHADSTKNIGWPKWTGLLTRQATVGSTGLVMSTLPTALSNGTVTGATVTASADATTGCIDLEFTPPSGNSQQWNAVAHVKTEVEVQ